MFVLSGQESAKVVIRLIIKNEQNPKGTLFFQGALYKSLPLRQARFCGMPTRTTIAEEVSVDGVGRGERMEAPTWTGL
jgi:hypothetical protein